jgi:hypothetical protein
MKTSLYVLLLLLAGCDSQADIEYNARKVQGMCEVFGAYPVIIGGLWERITVVCSNGLKLEVSTYDYKGENTAAGSKDSHTIP